MEKKEKTKKYTEKQFLAKLENISKEMGFHLSINPTFFPQDNGTFSIKIVTKVLPNK